MKKMAPSPENDNTPKAPDKSVDKTGRVNHSSHPRSAQAAAEDTDKNISVTSLDDGQLKALLDEAITYKTPRDREGKSELFKTLLIDAEDEIRKAHARSASGPELARYYNTTANRRHRNKRQKSSISENLTHGGSLNDLAKEELYESASNLQRPKKTVSTRQREGGSLPCNVNAGASYDKQYFLDEQKKLKKSEILDVSIDMESESLLENDSLGLQYNSCSDSGEMEVMPPRIPRIGTFTSKATLQINSVDDGVSFPVMESDKATGSGNVMEESYKPEAASHYSLLSMNSKWAYKNPASEERKVDENGNALSHSSAADTKKRKKSGKKAEDVIKSEDVKGHRADIINNIDMLLEFITGTEEKTKAPSKAKIHNKYVTDGKQHKQRTRSSKGSKSGPDHHLQKSNSMEEMSTMKLEDFHFEQEHGRSESGKIPLRSTKSNSERPRERKSWALCNELYQNASAENLESADFTFVTKKKKSKKRRNSLGSRKQTHSSDVHSAEFHRIPSPRRKSACSVPHSEKSNDSSDADSVHSLPLDSVEQLNAPISYADIAKCAEKPKVKPITPSKKEVEIKPLELESVFLPSALIKSPDVVPVLNNKNDLASLQNWPEIRNNKVNAVKNFERVHDWPSIQNNGLKNENKSPPKINNVKSNRLPSLKKEDSFEVPQANCVKENVILNKTQQVIQKVSEQHPLLFPYQMPPNIRDVQSIEKMQLKGLQNSLYINNGSGEPEDTLPLPTPVCEVDKRPAVVILSGGDKHVSDITFGFDINEQLLSGDVCADFTSRFFLPETNNCINLDKLVNFIGTDWEDIMLQTNSAGNNNKVKYYSEDL